MSNATLSEIAGIMMQPGKGILAMDESTSTCNKRFAAAGIPQTVEARQAYRNMIVTAPGLGNSISGAILYDETIRQKTKDGRPMAKAIEDAGILPGIKVDAGAKNLAAFPNEKITEGLDGLRQRFAEYKTMGAQFAKWRAVITIGQGIPSYTCLLANAHALGRYAALCQEAGMVPIVEPEVLMDGDHDINRCYDITRLSLQIVFEQLYFQRVDLRGMILKPNMVIAGKDCKKQNSTEEVANATVECLLQSVPAAVPGIAFLSGGQSAEKASAHLNAINKNYKSRLPWVVTFSFARAIQQDAMDIWKGIDANISKAQEALVYRAARNAAARRGEYIMAN
jgi:fructose-bisphosphate aldolase class I